MIIDIDDAKSLNDTHGHEEANKVWTALGTVIKDHFPEADVGRWGGEEFAIVLPKGEHAAADALLKAIPERVKIKGEPVTVSGGIGDNFKQADDNLYHSKQTGKNQIVVDNGTVEPYTIQGTPVGEKGYVTATDLRQVGQRAARLLGSSKVQRPEDRLALEGAIQAVDRIQSGNAGREANPVSQATDLSLQGKGPGSSEGIPSEAEKGNTAISDATPQDFAPSKLDQYILDQTPEQVTQLLHPSSEIPISSVPEHARPFVIEQRANNFSDELYSQRHKDNSENLSATNSEYDQNKKLSELHGELYDDLKNGFETWVGNTKVRHQGSYPGWKNDYAAITDQTRLTFGRVGISKKGQRIELSPTAKAWLSQKTPEFVEVGKTEQYPSPDDVVAKLQGSMNPEQFAKWAEQNPRAKEDFDYSDIEDQVSAYRKDLETQASQAPVVPLSTESSTLPAKTAPIEPTQMQLPGTEDNRTVTQKAIDAERQARDQQAKAAGVGTEGTPLFSANEREANATKQESLFPAGGSGNVAASVDKFAPREPAPAILEMPEIVQLAKQLTAKDPSVKPVLRAFNGTALGVFRNGTKDIELRADLFKEPEQAAKTLSHEIGHAVDYLPDETLKRGNILGRIATLKKYLKGTLDAVPENPGDFGFTPEDKINKPEIMKELKDLSQTWKPFDRSADAKFTAYRDKPKELYADAFSVLLNEPDLLKSDAPKFYRSMFAYMERKPLVKKAYEELLNRIGSGREQVLSERENLIREGYKQGEQKMADAQAVADSKKEGFVSNVKKLLWDSDQALASKIPKGIDPENNPLTRVRESRYMGSELENLYGNVSSKVLKPLYNSGLTKEDLGLYMQLRRASTEREALANPGGVGGKFAVTQLEALQKKLGPEKMMSLSDAAEQYWNIRNKLIIPRIDNGMFSKELMDKIKDNRNYATFNVLDHIGESTGGGGSGINASVKKQIGTLKNVSEPFTATVLKDSMLLRLAQKNETIKLAVQALGSEAKPSETRFVNNHHEAIEKDGADVRTVKYLENGKVKAFDIDKSIADVLDAPPALSNPAIQAITIPGRILKAVFVQYNPFWIARNVIRDALGTWRNFSRASVWNMAKFYTQVYPDAFKEVFKGQSSELLQQMKQEHAIFTGRNWSAKELGSAESELDRKMINFGVSPERYNENVTRPMNALMSGLRKYGSINNWGRLSEVAGKAAGFKMVKEKYPELGPHARAEAVRRRVGTPDFMTGGKARLIYNNLWLFSNVSKEGLRGAYESYASKLDSKAKFLAKVAVTDIVPNIMIKALETGALVGVGGLLGDYFSELQKKYKDIPENDKTNYYCIPLGSTESGKTVYMTIPKEQNTQMISNVMRKSLNFAEEKNPANFKEIISSASQQSPVGNINPLIEQLYNWNDFLQGSGDPKDFYKGREILTPTERLAGGWPAWKKMLEYTLGDMGANIWYKFPNDIRGYKSDFEKAYDIPVLGRGLNTFIRVSDRGQSEDLHDIIQEKRVENAKETLQIHDKINESIKNENTSEKEVKDLYRELKTGGYGRTLQEFKNTFRTELGKKSPDPVVRALVSARTQEEKDAVLKEVMDRQEIPESERKKFVWRYLKKLPLE